MRYKFCHIVHEYAHSKIYCQRQTGFLQDIVSDRMISWQEEGHWEEIFMIHLFVSGNNI